MITSIVMVSCDTARIPEVAEAIADLPAVSEVYSTTGAVDLIAIVRVREFDEVAEAIAGPASARPTPATRRCGPRPASCRSAPQSGSSWRTTGRR